MGGVYLSVVKHSACFACGALDALRLYEFDLEAESYDAAQFCLEFFLQSYELCHLVGEIFFLYLYLEFGCVGVVDAIDGEDEVWLEHGETE